MVAVAGIASVTATRAALIGDVVGSRHAADRSDLHKRMTAALRAAATTAVDPPAFTVRDEFQGSYQTVGDAIDAALRMRLAVAPGIDVRFGVGWGEVTILDERTRIQDGAAWWAAREAIEQTATMQRQPGLALVRTTVRGNRDDLDAINAALMCRDHLLGSLDDRSLRILQGLMNNRPKKDIAQAEGISPSAVSQRAGSDGLDLIVLASEHLQSIT